MAIQKIDSETRHASAPPPATAQPDLSERLAGKRVLFVINSDSGGGVEHLAAMIRSDLETAGARLETVFLYARAGLPKSAKIRGILWAALAVARARPDIIVTFQPTASAVAMTVGRFTGCRVRIAHQSNMPAATHSVPRALDRWVGTLGFYTVNIMNSAATADAFAAYPARYRNIFRRIGHGIEWHPPKRSRGEVRRAIGLSEETPMLLTCARLSDQKGLDVIVSALPHLPGVHFVLAGDGPERLNLQSLAARLGVSARTHFLGVLKHDDLFDLHGAADVFAFPSLWETFGIAAVEAAMQSLPIVASSIPPSREVLTIDGATPVTFVEDWAIDNWVTALASVLADPEKRRLARTFAPLFQKLYSVDGMRNEYRTLFEELLR